MLSMILTASVLYPKISGEMIIEILVAGGVPTIATFVAVSGFRRRGRAVNAPDDRLLLRDSWRMPPLQYSAAAATDLARPYLAHGSADLSFSRRWA